MASTGLAIGHSPSLTTSLIFAETRIELAPICADGYRLRSFSVAGIVGTISRKGEKQVQDLTERRNEEAREVRDLLAANLKVHPIWLGGLDTQAARHIYVFIHWCSS